MEQQRDATLRRLDLKPGERVVDIGCGPGFLCKSMAETEKRNEWFFSLNRYFFSVEKTRRS
jgi:cyclopropane fatty-acyl-phospholipid synthase-like methyltransferase